MIVCKEFNSLLDDHARHKLIWSIYFGWIEACKLVSIILIFFVYKRSTIIPGWQLKTEMKVVNWSSAPNDGLEAPLT